MTQTEFDKLPLLLRPVDVMNVLGVGRRQLRNLREANPAIACKLPGELEWKYFKAAIAELARVAYR